MHKEIVDTPEHVQRQMQLEMKLHKLNIQNAQINDYYQINIDYNIKIVNVMSSIVESNQAIAILKDLHNNVYKNCNIEVKCLGKEIYLDNSIITNALQLTNGFYPFHYSMNGYDEGIDNIIEKIFKKANDYKELMSMYSISNIKAEEFEQGEDSEQREEKEIKNYCMTNNTTPYTLKTMNCINKMQTEIYYNNKFNEVVVLTSMECLNNYPSFVSAFPELELITNEYLSTDSLRNVTNFVNANHYYDKMTMIDCLKKYIQIINENEEGEMVFEQYLNERFQLKEGERVLLSNVIKAFCNEASKFKNSFKYNYITNIKRLKSRGYRIDKEDDIYYVYGIMEKKTNRYHLIHASYRNGSNLNNLDNLMKQYENERDALTENGAIDKQKNESKLDNLMEQYENERENNIPLIGIYKYKHESNLDNLVDQFENNIPSIGIYKYKNGAVDKQKNGSNLDNLMEQYENERENDIPSFGIFKYIKNDIIPKSEQQKDKFYNPHTSEYIETYSVENEEEPSSGDLIVDKMLPEEVTTVIKPYNTATSIGTEINSSTKSFINSDIKKIIEAAQNAFLNKK